MMKDDKLDAGLISAYDGIRWGLKPSEKPVIEFFKRYKNQYKVLNNALKRDSEPVSIAVMGDRFIDLKLAYNLEKTLKTYYNKKVSVYKILVNRHNNSHPSADYSVKNLKEAGEIIESESINISIKDVDNTIVKSYMPKESNPISNKSNFDRFGKIRVVRGGFMLFTISDEFLSMIGLHPRRPYLKSEDSLDCVLDSSKKAGSFVIFNSSTNPITMKKVITANSNYEFNFLYNYFL